MVNYGIADTGFRCLDKGAIPMHVTGTILRRYTSGCDSMLRHLKGRTPYCCRSSFNRNIVTVLLPFLQIFHSEN